MPLVIRPRPPRSAIFGWLVAAFAGMLVAAPAGVAASCTTPASAAPVFARFGDTAEYVLVPGGNFESRATNRWTLTGGALVAGNEPFDLGSSRDAQSLTLLAGGTAESPAICVDGSRPFWRFVARSRDGSGISTLRVWAQWSDSVGAVHTTPATTLATNAYATWAATPRLALGTALGNSAASVSAHLFFGTTGRWQIDDVYVDPYRVG